jgi:polyisoprenyl-phosphate glycosyltransferase
MRCSIVIPVYGNAGSISEVFARLDGMARDLPHPMEVVFVVDGSPDDSQARIEAEAERGRFLARVAVHSRNFGSFAAIRTGLGLADGPYFAVMSADLQEPAEWALGAFRLLARDACDVVLGVREERGDPLGTRLTSSLFWRLYRYFVQPEMPAGGVDMFGCNTAVRDALLTLGEQRSSLVGQLMWIGFRRAELSYPRLPRRHDKSGWSLGRKLNYMADSVFAFTDLPIRLLQVVGGLGLVVCVVAALVVLGFRLAGKVPVLGYTPIVLAILFSTFLMLLGIGVLGGYLSRAFENSKGRPLALVARVRAYPAAGHTDPFDTR